MKLLRISEWRAAGKGEVLAAEGEDIGDPTLIYNGEVVIEKNGAEVARSRDGTLVGEMSFIQGGTATATVRAARETRLFIWPKEELQKSLKRNPTMYIAMNSVFTSDLTRKLGGAPA
jgi:CRP-like cAMP-binding protein